MEVHTLKKITEDKEKLKFSKGETSGYNLQLSKQNTLQIQVYNKMQGTLALIPRRTIMEFPQIQGYPPSNFQMTPN